MIVEVTFQLFLFVAAIFVVFYTPGCLLFSVSKIEMSESLSRFSMRLGLGLVTVPVLYQIFRRLNAPDLVLLTIFLLVFAYWFFKIGRKTRELTKPIHLTSFVLGFVVVGFLLGFSHISDFRLSDGGSIYRTTQLSESVFHQGLVNAIRDSFPPPSIYAAGSGDFSHYHLNMHLQVEGLYRLTGIGTDRLVFWFFPSLYFFTLFTLSYSFVTSRGGGPVSAAAAGMLVFGTGFSYLPGFLGLAEPSFAWVQFFHPDVFSLFTLNGLLPALVALFVVITAIPFMTGGQSIGFWVVLGLAVLGGFGFKSSMGLQIAAVLLALGFIRFVFDKSNDGRDWRTTVFGAVMLMIMLLDQQLLRSGIGSTLIEFRPWDILDNMLSRLGIENVEGIVMWGYLFGVVMLTLGVRLVGFITLRKNIEEYPADRWLMVFVSIFFISGYVLSEVFYLGDSESLFNHSGWFAIQGIIGTWFLVFLFLARLDAAKGVNKSIIFLMVVLAYPSTLQLLWLKSQSPEVLIGPHEQEVVEFLRSTGPEDVFLHPLNQGVPSLASNLAGRSSVLNVHLSFVNETQGLEQRAIGTLTFFDPETDTATRTAIMDYYGVTHVYGPTSFDEWLVHQKDLKRVFSNGIYTVWAVAY